MRHTPHCLDGLILRIQCKNIEASLKKIPNKKGLFPSKYLEIINNRKKKITILIPQKIHSNPVAL